MQGFQMTSHLDSVFFLDVFGIGIKIKEKFSYISHWCIKLHINRIYENFLLFLSQYQTLHTQSVELHIISDKEKLEIVVVYFVVI